MSPCRDDSGWCSDMTSTHGAWGMGNGAWGHAGVRFLLPGVLAYCRLKQITVPCRGPFSEIDHPTGPKKKSGAKSENERPSVPWPFCEAYGELGLRVGGIQRMHSRIAFASGFPPMQCETASYEAPVVDLGFGRCFCDKGLIHLCQITEITVALTEKKNSTERAI